MIPVEFTDFLKNIDYIDVNGNVNGEIKGVEINSLYIEKGDLFFALETGKRSGSLFASDALKRGAIAVVTEHETVPSPYVKVKDSLGALTDFAKYYRGLFSPKIIGITGSAGKTTVKEMLYSILSSRFSTAKNKGNFNNHIGVPYSIFGINDNTEFAIFELGMNHTGEIKHLSEIIKPNIATITSVAPCHIGYFNGLDEILQAKLELYYSLNSGDIFIVNAYDKMLSAFKRRKDIKHIVVGDEGDYRISEFKGDKRSIEFKINGVSFRIPVIGRFNAVNAAISVAIGDCFGVGLKESSHILSDYRTVEGRMTILNPSKDVFVIDDTYNANPAAFENMLTYIKSNYREKKFAVIGDMLELGEFGEFYHRKLGEELDDAGFEMILYNGNYFEYVSENIKKGIIKRINEKNLKDLIRRIGKGDVVLFKGSRGMRMERWLNKFLEGFKNDL